MMPTPTDSSKPTPENPSRPTSGEVVDPCTICSKPKLNHPYRHGWVGYGDDKSGLFEVSSSTPPPRPPQNDGTHTPAESFDSAVRSSQGRSGNALQGDPVLRLALIRAGIIKVEDLDRIEGELRAAGVASNVAAPLGQP